MYILVKRIFWKFDMFGIEMSMEKIEKNKEKYYNIMSNVLFRRTAVTAVYNIGSTVLYLILL